MKARRFTSIHLSTLFRTTLLSAMFVMPLVLAARHDAGVAAVAADAQVWERSPYAPARAEPRRDAHLPHAAAPMDKSCGPDAAMIRPGKARAKTIRV